MPTLVQDLSGVGSVSCGNTHTLVLSADGKTVWSFGSGEGGKLGHGDGNNVAYPKVIDALVGLYLRKVIAGSLFSIALTCNGSVSGFYCICSYWCETLSKVFFSIFLTFH